MMFGGSTATPPMASASPSVPVSVSAPTFAQPEIVQLPTNDGADLISKVLQETKQAEEEDHRRVTSHHDFIRQQTQQAVHLQQSQANEFLQQYLAENKKQLDAHLSRLRSGFPLLHTSNSSGDLEGNHNNTTVFGLERKLEILERKVEEKDIQLSQYNALMLAVEEQHREELREMRSRQEEASQRTVQTHHEYVVSLMANNDSVRRQYEEALSSLREAVSAKSSLEVVRGTVEQSAREFAVWRTELEQKHESVVREKDGQLQVKENQIKELTNMLERQNENSRAEREILQQRIQEDTARMLKRQSEVEEQVYTLQRERVELESERKNFQNLQTKEMQRFEKRLEETFRERQNAVENLSEERHVFEEEKRKLSETIRAAEEKYAVEFRKRQLLLDSALELVTVEKRLLEEKHRNLDREIAAVKEERDRLERDKKDASARKEQLDKYNEELHRRDLELEQTAFRVAKIKREGDLALHEAKFLDEEHKNRVAKFNAFLEQLREKELTLMRQAVGEVDSDSRSRSAFQLPNGALTVVSHRPSSNGKMQLLPNPASEHVHHGRWQSERDYLQVLKNTPWNTKKSL